MPAQRVALSRQAASRACSLTRFADSAPAQQTACGSTRAGLSRHGRCSRYPAGALATLVGHGIFCETTTHPRHRRRRAMGCTRPRVDRSGRRWVLDRGEHRVCRTGHCEDAGAPIDHQPGVVRTSTSTPSGSARSVRIVRSGLQRVWRDRESLKQLPLGGEPDAMHPRVGAGAYRVARVARRGQSQQRVDELVLLDPAIL